MQHTWYSAFEICKPVAAAAPHSTDSISRPVRHVRYMTETCTDLCVDLSTIFSSRGIITYWYSHGIHSTGVGFGQLTSHFTRDKSQLHTRSTSPSLSVRVCTS